MVAVAGVAPSTHPIVHSVCGTLVAGSCSVTLLPLSTLPPTQVPSVYSRSGPLCTCSRTAFLMLRSLLRAVFVPPTASPIASCHHRPRHWMRSEYFARWHGRAEEKLIWTRFSKAEQSVRSHHLLASFVVIEYFFRICKFVGEFLMLMQCSGYLSHWSFITARFLSTRKL